MSSNRLILQDFMEASLVRAGALVERPEYGLLEAVLPDDLAKHFMTDHLMLAFDYEVAGEQPGSTFVTYGSNLLDKAIGLALNYGRFTNMYRTDISSTPPGNLEKKVRESLEFLRCRPPRVIHRWMVDHIFYEFNFRCVFRSYERSEALVTVVVDGYTGLVRQGFSGLWKNVVPREQPEHRLPRADTLPLPDLYRQAVQEAELQVRKKAEPLLRAAGQLKERELAKISRYYEQTIREIEIKISNTQDAGKKERLQKQLAATANDRRRRENDAAARYNVEVEARLDHLVAYHLPCVHIKLEVQHKSMFYNQIVVYNPYSNDFESPACPACGGPARRLVPGDAGRLVCDRH